MIKFINLKTFIKTKTMNFQTLKKELLSYFSHYKQKSKYDVLTNCKNFYILNLRKHFSLT